MRLEINKAKLEVKPENRVVLITGDGKPLISDVTTFIQWEIPHDVIAIGRSINYYPSRVHHWANVDGNDSKWWAEHLPLKNDGRMPIRHSLGDLPWYDVDWDIKDDVIWGKDDAVLWHGSTALFAVYISIAMGYKKVVLAGCPMDSRGHWWDPAQNEGPRWQGEAYQAWFEFDLSPEAEKVKSLSGYTSQILGVPRKEWVNGI